MSEEQLYLAISLFLLYSNPHILALFGFVAEMVDGALGMGFGVLANSLLLTFGLVPVMGSAIVHTAECFTTLVNGASHLRLGNFDRQLFLRLAPFGCASGIVGAYLLSKSINLEPISAFVNIYLVVAGVLVLQRAFGLTLKATRKHVPALAVLGGMFDALGGGGWGPIVTSTLSLTEQETKNVIGTVNLSEFFITFSQTVTFILTLGPWYVGMSLPFIVGGIVASVLSAYVCRKTPKKWLTVLLGFLVICMAMYRLYPKITQ